MSNVGGMLVKQVIKANAGALLIQVIALDYPFDNLMRPAANDYATTLSATPREELVSVANRLMVRMCDVLTF